MATIKNFESFENAVPLSHLNDENYRQLEGMLEELGAVALTELLHQNQANWFQIAVEAVPQLIFPEDRHKQFTTRLAMMEGLNPYQKTSSTPLSNKPWYYKKTKHPIEVLLKIYNDARKS